LSAVCQDDHRQIALVANNGAEGSPDGNIEHRNQSDAHRRKADSGTVKRCYRSKLVLRHAPPSNSRLIANHMFHRLPPLDAHRHWNSAHRYRRSVLHGS